MNELYTFHTFCTKSFNQEKSQNSGFKLQHGKIKYTASTIYFLWSQDVSTMVHWGSGGEWLNPERKVYPRGEKGKDLFDGNFKTSFQTVCSTLDLKESHIRKGKKILQRMLILIAHGFPVKHGNLNAYSEFLLQSLILCALKRRKDNPINCSLEIKALFCRFSPDLGQHY